MTQRRLLITGSSGRLGGALARHLAAEHEIVQLDLLEPHAAELRGLGPVFEGSITDVSLVERAMEGVDAVVHCAAFPGPIQPFDELMETNVQGTFVLLEEAGKREGVDQFIYVSSIQWHGLHEEHGARQLPEFLPITEEHPSLATGYYDTSKVLGEHLCQVYTQRFGTPRGGFGKARQFGEQIFVTVPTEPMLPVKSYNDRTIRDAKRNGIPLFQPSLVTFPIRAFAALGGIGIIFFLALNALRGRGM